MLSIDDLSLSITPEPVTESDDKCNHQSHGRRKRDASRNRGRKNSKKESDLNSEERLFSLLNRCLRVIQNHKNESQKRLAATLKFQESIEKHAKLKAPIIRKNIDVMESLTELEIEIRVVDLVGGY